MLGRNPWLLSACTLLWLAACAAAEIESTPVQIVARYPHDAEAFTQGLLIKDNVLFESTGQYGRSTLRLVDLKTGRVLQSVALDERYFGEGLALANEKLYQLTWKAGLAFVYDPDSLERIGRFRYAGEGWGLTWDGAHLIMSDGSATLRLINPRDFSVAGHIRVTENGQPLTRLNELEYINGTILANVWFTDRVVCIEPDTGRVVATLDATALRDSLPADMHSNVLNGIAWDARTRGLYMTGKYWPRLFKVVWPDMERACAKSE